MEEQQETQGCRIDWGVKETFWKKAVRNQCHTITWKFLDCIPVSSESSTVGGIIKHNKCYKRSSQMKWAAAHYSLCLLIKLSVQERYNQSNFNSLALYVRSICKYFLFLFQYSYSLHCRLVKVDRIFLWQQFKIVLYKNCWSEMGQRSVCISDSINHNLKITIAIIKLK